MADGGGSEPAVPPAPSRRERRREWFDRRARLKVTVDTWPASAPPTNYSFHSGQRQLVIKVALAVSVLAAIATLFVAPPLIVLVIAILFNVVMRALPTPGMWTERCVAPALARAAEALGTQTGTREWLITGEPAVALGAELSHLQQLPSPTRPDGAYPTPLDIERQHLAAAGPILRQYLRPVLTAREHGNEPLGVIDDSAPLAPGDPWPLLDSGAPQWTQPRRGSHRT
jgi:hypothetical protein